MTGSAKPKNEYAEGYRHGEAAERSLIVRYLKALLLTERAAAISRGEHKDA